MLEGSSAFSHSLDPKQTSGGSDRYAPLRWIAGRTCVGQVRGRGGMGACSANARRCMSGRARRLVR